MATLYQSNTNDGRASNYAIQSWVDTRIMTTSGQSSSTNTTEMNLTQHVSGRGAIVTSIARIFFEFDTSGISVAPTAGNLKIYGAYSRTDSDLILVRSTQSGAVVAADFDAIYNASTELAASDGANGGTLDGISGLKYSSVVSSWTTSGYNDFPLTADALSDMASLSTFACCIMNWSYDFRDIAPSLGTTVGAGVTMSNYTGTSRDPYIDYTPGTAAVADNATFFGANF